MFDSSITLTKGQDRVGPTVMYDIANTLVPLQFGGDFLWLAIVFFVLAVVAAVVGMRGVAGISMEIARILIIVFIILAVVSLLL